MQQQHRHPRDHARSPSVTQPNSRGTNRLRPATIAANGTIEVAADSACHVAGSRRASLASIDGMPASAVTRNAPKNTIDARIAVADDMHRRPDRERPQHRMPGHPGHTARRLRHRPRRADHRRIRLAHRGDEQQERRQHRHHKDPAQPVRHEPQRLGRRHAPGADEEHDRRDRQQREDGRETASRRCAPRRGLARRVPAMPTCTPIHISAATISRFIVIRSGWRAAICVA